MTVFKGDNSMPITAYQRVISLHKKIKGINKESYSISHNDVGLLCAMILQDADNHDPPQFLVPWTAKQCLTL